MLVLRALEVDAARLVQFSINFFEFVWGKIQVSTETCFVVFIVRSSITSTIGCSLETLTVGRPILELVSVI